MPRRTIQSRMVELRKVTGASGTTGWMHDEVCWLLLGLVRFYQPSLVIQTGHLWGKSALVVLEALHHQRLDTTDGMGDPAYAEFVQNNSPRKTKGKLISIDPQPMGVPNPAAGVDLLHAWYSNFVYVDTTSAEFFAHFETAPDERILGIVDGDHTTQGAAADVEALGKLGAGMILLDDTSWIPRLRAAGEMEGYSTLELPDYNGVTVMVRQ